jgi:WD40 repeat protein
MMWYPIWGGTRYGRFDTRASSGPGNNFNIQWLIDVTKNDPKIIVQKGHFSAIQKVAFRPQGDLLVSGPFMGSLGFWDSRGICVNQLAMGGQSLQDLAWHPSGERFAVAGNFSVAVWTPGGEKRMVLDHPEMISALCYTPDGERLVVAMNSAIWIWSDGGERIGSATIEDDGFSCLAVTSAGRIAAEPTTRAS